MVKILKNELEFPKDKLSLLNMGCDLLERFRRHNSLQGLEIFKIDKGSWFVSACAYYRKNQINICIEHCGRPCTESMSRNWTWPGSTIDREPYGVLAHEFGHHVDLLHGSKPCKYYSEFSDRIRKQSGEPKLTGYCPNNAEWFAEMFRLFITNPDLLRRCRPKTHKIFCSHFKSVVDLDWREALGLNVPKRVVVSNTRKMVCS